MSHTQIVEADLTWTGKAFEAGVQVAIDATGHIDRVGKLGQTPIRRLTYQALLPGMINAHSHAFQRGLRGRGERFSTAAGSFWTWRDAMYELVELLDAEAFAKLCGQAFREMLDCGITAVGEFHYFHHRRGKTDYAFDQLVLDAAQKVGIRLVLLNTYYNTGGIGQPLTKAQHRFESVSPGAYWEQMDRLTEQLHPASQTLGVAVHSIRAATLDDLASIQSEATRRDLVFHMHVEEQRREIEECVAAYDKRPMALLNDASEVTSNITAVHCTHAQPRDLEQFLDAGGSVCICPLTEGNLGDGVPDLSQVHGTAGRLSLGTDSNARISMIEEMRWLEYGQRLRSETRGVIASNEGNVANALFEIATVGGARALALEAGSITPGAWADLVAVDLRAPALARCDENTLLDALVFGAGNEVVSATCVGGRWRERAERGF